MEERFLLKFNFEVVRPMWSRSGGEGFAKDVGKFMVVHQNTSHVNQSIIRGECVGKEELVDLSPSWRGGQRLLH